MDIVQSSNRVVNSFPPLNNITPFTRVDGWSFLEVLEGLRNYVVNILVKEIDDRNNAITGQMNQWFNQYILDHNKLLNDIEAEKVKWQEFFDQFMIDVTNQIAILNDNAVAQLIEDESSKTGAKSREVFADKDTQTQVKETRLPNIEAVGNKLVAGLGAASKLESGFPGNSSIVAIGRDAMGNATQMKTGIAIGSAAMQNGTMSRDNIAIGDSALKNVQGTTPDYDQVNNEGTRNVAIGGNAGLSITSGRASVLIGRNAGQNIVNGVGTVAIGGAAQSSEMPIGLSGEIEMWAPLGTGQEGLTEVTAVGYAALTRNSATKNTAFGSRALTNLTSSQFNVAIGDAAMLWLDAGTWIDGRPLTTVNIEGTYSQSGSSLILNIPNHGAAVGDTVLIRLTSGASQTLQGDRAPAVVTSVSGESSFTVQHPIPRVASGSAELRGVVKAGATAANRYNTAVGSEAGRLPRTATGSSFIGCRTGYWMVDSLNNTAVGAMALAGTGSDNVTGVTESVAVGRDALTRISDGSDKNTAVGAYSGNRLTTGKRNTFIGNFAGSLDYSGANLTGYDNVTALGAGSRASGSNQVQLGDSDTTPYAFNALQLRSDLRDKADVRDSSIGLDFIKKLRPVDYKYDLRDDYKNGKRDGSKKRSRYHHGLIAQEVEKVINETGVDFGGFQDHKINGGGDVLTIGYEELISPLIKAVQELSNEVSELKKKLGE